MLYGVGIGDVRFEAEVVYRIYLVNIDCMSLIIQVIQTIHPLEQYGLQSHLRLISQVGSSPSEEGSAISQVNS